VTHWPTDDEGPHQYLRPGPIDGDTPIAAFGIRDVSLPVAAKLIGFSVRTVRKMIAEGAFGQVNGYIQLRIPLDALEAVHGAVVTLRDWMQATTGRQPRRVFSQGPVQQAAAAKRRS